MTREININTVDGVRNRREDVYFAYYIEGMSIKLIVEFSGFSETTIRRDLQYIASHLAEFKDE